MINWVRLTMLSCAILFSAATLSQAQPNADSATEIRVTFIYHIINYSRWQSEMNDVTFCVLEPKTSQKYLSTLKSEPFMGASKKTVSMKSVNHIEETKTENCHYLFVDKNSESKQVYSHLQRLKPSTISIGETSKFIEQGGTMSLIEEFNKIKIYINRDNYKSAPAKFSARLLKYANFTG